MEDIDKMEAALKHAREIDHLANGKELSLGWIAAEKSYLEYLRDHGAVIARAPSFPACVFLPLPRARGSAGRGIERIAVLEEALRTVRVFARDCIDNGHDRAMLGNMYGACDAIDAALKAPSDG